jgi:hypothetical protein
MIGSLGLVLLRRVLGLLGIGPVTQRHTCASRRPLTELALAV